MWLKPFQFILSGLLVIVFGLMLQACGYTGNLYLPKAPLTQKMEKKDPTAAIRPVVIAPLSFTSSLPSTH